MTSVSELMTGIRRLSAEGDDPAGRGRRLCWTPPRLRPNRSVRGWVNDIKEVRMSSNVVPSGPIEPPAPSGPKAPEIPDLGTPETDRGVSQPPPESGVLGTESDFADKLYHGQ